MSRAASYPRPPKRSRATDSASEKNPNEDLERVKRRRFWSNSEEIPSVSLDNSGKHDNNVSVLSQDPGATKRSSSARWSLSRPMAGEYSNLDPILTSDERHIFVGLDTAVQVYVATTSRLFRTWQSDTPHRVVSYRACPKNEENIYIFTSSGSVSKWDWPSGKVISRVETACKILRAEISLDGSSDDAQALSYTIRERKDGKREIWVSPLEGSMDKVVVLETSKRIFDFKLAWRGRVIVAWDGQGISVGMANALDSTDLDSIKYVWREVVLPVNVTCLDIRETVASTPATGRGSTRGKASERVDLVVGESSGSILILDDVLNSLPSSKIDVDHQRHPISRRLHWHRGRVNSVRWSRDGNYVISGGDESVLVLWQLDTGRKQFLPHMSSPICNIALSPSGNSYAIKLSNNSVLVISARELQPYATITGLQLAPYAVDRTERSAALRKIPAILHPQHPDKLLIVVPASHGTSQRARHRMSSCILQTYDVNTNQHISRQALARTNATVLKIGPEGEDITSPDIKHLQLAHDGKWMATIDDWHPNSLDIKALWLSAHSDFSNRQEIFLKFWKWSNSSEMWELAARIDAPHFSKGESLPVLSLASRPSNYEFVTIAADQILRFWSPVARQSSGLKSVDNAERQLETWRCRRSIHLKRDLADKALSESSAACMDFSEDGSVLAVCMKSASVKNHSVVHLIDVQNGEVRQTRDGISWGEPYDMKFVGRHLVIASSQSLCAWDIISDAVRPVRAPDMNGVSSTTACRRLLAGNTKTQTFAVATQGSSPHQQAGVADKKRRKPRFHVQIYDIRSLELQDQRVLKNTPVALLSDPNSADYVIVDAASCVVRIGRHDKTARMAVQTRDLADQMETGISGLFGIPSCASHSTTNHADLVPETRQVNLPSAQSKGIAGIFGDGPSFNLPSLTVLFKGFVQSLTRS